jgi:hypothetical protein
VAQLVREACTQRPAPKALEALIAAVEAVVPAEEWRAREEEADRRGALVEVIQASAAANDTRLARRLTAAVLTSREEWDLDRVVIPALLLTGGARAADGLRAACVAHLEERIALPLDPPANASRATEGLTCRCAHCNAARAFLSHPKRTALDVKENTAIRDHLRSALEAARSDVECTLIRQGRPYTLRLTKTQASHERRVAQRRDDQEKRAELTRQSQPPTAADGDR